MWMDELHVIIGTGVGAGYCDISVSLNTNYSAVVDSIYNINSL